MGIPHGLNPLSCPLRAVEAWLKRSRIEWEPVFRRVSAGGGLEDRLSTQGVWRILKRRAKMANLVVHESERLSPHDLRARFITETYLKGALDEQVMHHTPGTPLVHDPVPAFEVTSWIGLAGPARLPDAAVTAWNTALSRDTASPEFQRPITENGLEVLSQDQATFRAAIAADSKRWEDVIRSAAIRKE